MSFHTRDPRDRYDWISDTWSVVPSHLPMPVVSVVRHFHTCPDGTEVVVSGQWITVVTATLYRWWVNGEWAGCTNTREPPYTPPDWTTIDALHPAGAQAVPAVGAVDEVG